MYKIARLSLIAAILVSLASVSFAHSDDGIQPVEPIWDIEKYRTLSQLWQQVDEYWHEGDYDNCISILKKITDVDPSQSEAYVNAAWLLESTNKTFEGFDMLVRNVIANPRDPDPYFELGTKYYYFGAYKEAVKNLEAASRLKQSSLYERMLGHAYERAGEREKAIEMFASVLGRDPNDGAALLNLVRILNRIPPAHDPTSLWHRPDP